MAAGLVVMAVRMAEGARAARIPMCIPNGWAQALRSSIERERAADHRL